MTVVCITTYNEESSIGPLIYNIHALGYPTIIVDDCSTDSTVQIAKMEKALVISNPKRIGIGPSLMLAWSIARRNRYGAVVQLDAGNSHNPTHIKTLMDVQRATMAHVVVGSRFMPGSKYNNERGVWWRPLASRIASKAMNYAHGSRYSDWTSGFRYYSPGVLDYLLEQPFTTTMHSWQIECLAYASAAGFKVAEAPIGYVSGRSSFNRKIAWQAFQVWNHVLNHVGWPGSGI